jgi:very-short-patch-repair endonuclease
MSSISVTHPEVAAQWHPTRNGDLRPEDFTAGSDHKVWWKCNITCPEGCEHSWDATIGSRCRGNGCPYCASNGRKFCIHETLSFKYPDISKEWHPLRNETLMPSDVSTGSSVKVWWLCSETCPKGCLHEYQMSIAKRTTRGDSCPYCAGKKLCPHISLKETHPDIALQWHPTLNKIKVDEITSNSGRKVWWLCPNTCPEGCKHEWEAIISNRVKGRGCPKCSNKGQITIPCYHLSIQYTHPQIAAQWHPEKNGDLRPTNVSFGSTQQVWWLCPNTCPEGCKHEWKTAVSNRGSSKSGCPYCAINKKAFCKHMTINYTHPEIAKQLHPTKNNISALDILAGSGIKVWWTCNKGHEWQSIIGSRTKGTGCPHCVNKTEAKLYDYLRSHFPDAQAQFSPDWIKPRRFDFYISSINLIVELDGPQHFRQISNWNCHVKTTEADVYKMQRAFTNGLSVLRLLQEEVADASESWLNENVKPCLTKYDSPQSILIVSEENANIYDEHERLLEGQVAEPLSDNEE